VEECGRGGGKEGANELHCGKCRGGHCLRDGKDDNKKCRGGHCLRDGKDDNKKCKQKGRGFRTRPGHGKSELRSVAMKLTQTLVAQMIPCDQLQGCETHPKWSSRSLASIAPEVASSMPLGWNPGSWSPGACVGR
jgi:hypothetical protein